MIGSYLCYRRDLENQIWIANIGQSNSKYTQKTRSLSLRQFVKEEKGENLIDFHAVSGDSHLTVKSRGTGVESRYYDHLL